jgi:hypothetical protein
MEELEIEHALKVKIDRFEGKFAVLATSDGQTVRWPIKELPDDAQEGTAMRLLVSTAKSEAVSRQRLARAMINTLLSN